MSLLVEDAVTQLNDMVSADGAVIRLVGETSTTVDLELDLSQSNCPECVVPKSLLLQIVRAQLLEVAPDIAEVTLVDPREGTALAH